MKAVLDVTPYRCCCQSMNQSERIAIITAVLANAPQWIRHDLGSVDAKLRLRAEESLAAIIAAALNGSQATTSSD
ncbi:MAG: DUF6771 family protein [Pseudomonadota bacterium]